MEYKDYYQILGVPRTATQDDMAMLAGSQNGFGYRPDDHPSTVATASRLNWSPGGVVEPVSGVIERASRPKASAARSRI